MFDDVMMPGEEEASSHHMVVTIRPSDDLGQAPSGDLGQAPGVTSVKHLVVTSVKHLGVTSVKHIVVTSVKQTDRQTKPLTLSSCVVLCVFCTLMSSRNSRAGTSKPQCVSTAQRPANHTRHSDNSTLMSSLPTPLSFFHVNLGYQLAGRVAQW